MMVVARDHLQVAMIAEDLPDHQAEAMIRDQAEAVWDLLQVDLQVHLEAAVEDQAEADQEEVANS
jgi:hypothetical protein